MYSIMGFLLKKKKKEKEKKRQLSKNAHLSGLQKVL